MRVLAALLVSLAALFVAGGAAAGLCDGATAPPALAAIEIAGPTVEQFVVRILDQVTLDELVGICNGTQPPRNISGALRTGNGGYNEDAANGRIWSWHLDEQTVHLADATIEVCHGLPSGVEAALQVWVESLGQYCPPFSGVAAVTTDAALNGDLDVDGDVDAADLAQLDACLPSEPCYVDFGGGCCRADLDADVDVDCADREALVAAWTGPGAPPPPVCSLVPALPTWAPPLLAALLALAFRTASGVGAPGGARP